MSVLSKIGEYSRRFLSRLKMGNTPPSEIEDKENQANALSNLSGLKDRPNLHRSANTAISDNSSEEFTPLLIDQLPRNMTVSKLGFGTYTDQNGIIRFCPNNILLNSNLFTGSGWTRVNCEVNPTNTTSPVVGEKAWRLIESTDQGAHYIYGKSYDIINSHILISVFAKALERNCLVLEISNFKTGSAGCRFNLAKGEAETALSTTDDYRDLAAKITEYANGWYRCSLRVGKGSETRENYLTLSTALADGNLYKGDGRSGLLIACAQVELVTYQTEPGLYFNTRNQPAFGLRFDHDSSSRDLLGLMIEQESENFLNRGEGFEQAAPGQDGWIYHHIKRVAENMLTPSGEKLGLSLAAEDENATIQYSKPCDTAKLRTLSCWFRSAGGSHSLEYTVDGGESWQSFEINQYWRRYAWPLPVARHRIGFRLPSKSQVIEIWGAQLEDGNQATSYIPHARGITKRQEDELIFLDRTGGSLDISIFDYASQKSEICRVKNGKELTRKNIAINGWRSIQN